MFQQKLTCTDDAPAGILLRLILPPHRSSIALAEGRYHRSGQHA